MSFRTVVITKQCKLSYKDHYLVVRDEDVKLIHLSEINTLIVDTTMVSITAYLLCELVKRKVAIIFCDEKHHPYAEVMSLYGNHNTSKKVLQQTQWQDAIKQAIWTAIVKRKIYHQAQVLQVFDKTEANQLLLYGQQVCPGDSTNREGHAAKVYFHALFGANFSRDMMDSINVALDYGYAFILAIINREVIANGYITQIGIGHKNEFNYYNLSCDLMEPLRAIIDEYICHHMPEEFTKDVKLALINLLNKEVKYGENTHYLNNAISLYVKNTLQCITAQKVQELQFITWL
jgi:CRISPR-associated endonuclease Cas1 subtype II